MMLDRFAQRAVLVLCLLSFVLCPLCAQSNVTYDLRVGATGEVKLLAEFPENYQGEKVNIRVQTVPLTETDLDFVFVHEGPVDGFDSIYSYTDESEMVWTVWRNNKQIKNRAQRVRAGNAYHTFESYVREHTAGAQRSHGWIWWVFAGLALALALAVAVSQIIQRRRERLLSPVEQEILHRKRMGNRRHYGSQLYLWLLLIVLYAPIALIAVFSFTKSKILGNWTGFSFDLYVNLFTGQADAGLNSAIWYTVVIALIAAVCSTILGTLAAIGIYNMRAASRKTVSLLNSVPMINPDIITGISLFLLFVALGMSQGLATVCIAHVVFCTPYVVLSVLPRLSRMNPNTYEAALDLGATPGQALRMVMLPELWPGMLSGFILALTLSVDDFGVTFFTKGSGGLETLSTFIYSDARKGGLTPELRPLFTLILLVMLVALIIINIRNNKQQEK